jgi:hypothetical protein
MFGLGLVCYDYVVSRFALVHYVARDAQPSLPSHAICGVFLNHSHTILQHEHVHEDIDKKETEFVDRVEFRLSVANQVSGVYGWVYTNVQ